jgi:hypothetical protein
MDPERLAALLDGRVDADERARLVARLAASSDDAAVFADALAVTVELQAEDAAAARGAAGEGDDGQGAAVIPLRPARRRWPGVPRRWLALAAAATVVALVPLAWSARKSPPAGVETYAALLRGGGLPAGWNARPWPATRADADPLTPGARGARIGARLVDLRLAVRARDPAAKRLAAEVAGLLEALPASGPATAVYREVERRAGGPPEALEPLLERGERAASRLAGGEAVALGAWAEAARLAAARRDAAFFRARASRDALRRAAVDAALPAPARAAARRVDAALRAEGATDWPALGGDLDQLLGALGSG